MKSTIVFLRSNPVNPDSRVEKEANTLLKYGYDVRILGWDRSSRYKIKETTLNLSDGQAIISRFGIPAEYGAGKRNLKAFLLFQYRIFTWLVANQNLFDVVHACDFDTAYTAYCCNKILKKKLVFDIFDYLYTSVDGKFAWFKKCIVSLQYKIIDNADGTIICTEKRKHQISGSKPKKLVVIHNSPPAISDQLRTMNLNKSKVKIAYVGILQDYRFLIELADVVKIIPECELHIGGFGKYEIHFENMSKLYENIFYYGKLPYYTTLELENSCDIMTAIYDPEVDNHYYAAPNKFYEAIMIGKPLIMVGNTGMSEIVTEFGLGEVIEFSTQGLEKAIRNLINRKAEWPEISAKMKAIYTKYYSWSEMESRLVQFYEEIRN